MFKTLYKRSHLIASAIIICGISLAGAAIAMNRSTAQDTTPAMSAAPVIGRFVVTPQNVRYIPGAQPAVEHSAD